MPCVSFPSGKETGVINDRFVPVLSDIRPDGAPSQPPDCAPRFSAVPDILPESSQT